MEGKAGGRFELRCQAVETLLKKSIALDGSIAEAHLQLGNLYADQHQYAESIPEYVRALSSIRIFRTPTIASGRTTSIWARRIGPRLNSMSIKKLRAQHLADVDKERAEVQQFIYSSKSEGSSKP